jgi:hypothetical protein
MSEDITIELVEDLIAEFEGHVRDLQQGIHNSAAVLYELEGLHKAGVKMVRVGEHLTPVLPDNVVLFPGTKEVH